MATEEKAGLLDRIFKLRERGTNVGTELLAGLTTFMTLSYIIFVQPVVLGQPKEYGGAGMDPGAVMVATCVASALACLIMAFTANYPIALAPAMGHNFFFSLIVCGTMGYTWEQALTAVCIAGVIFMGLSFFGFRARIMEIIPDSLKRAIAGGIGLLIALVGLEYAGIIIGHPASYLTLGQLRNKFTILAVFGLAVTLALYALRFKGAIIAGMVVTTIVGLATGILTTEGVKSYDSLDPGKTLFMLDFVGLFKDRGLEGAVTIILIFLFLDVFDTVGTLIGVSERAGLLVDGRLPRARWALFSDSCGTVIGACLGTSTVTSYVESAAGVQAGGRTGLANIMTALLLLLSIFAYPFLGIIGHEHVMDNPFLKADQLPANLAWILKGHLYPVIAPALILVGAMMLQSLKNIEWDDPTEFVPAFLTIIIMPLTLNITEGIAFGFISYTLLKLVTRRMRDAHWGIHVLSAVLMLRYIFLKN